MKRDVRGPCLKRSRFLTSVPVVPLNRYMPFKIMYRLKGVKCVRVKDSCLFEHVRMVSYRYPVVTLNSLNYQHFSTGGLEGT